MDFCNRLRELRKSRGVSQKELAKELGVSPSALTMYECGRREPNFETLDRIADFFNVPVGYLMGDKPMQVDDLWQMREQLLRRPELKTLFDLSSKASTADVEKAITIVKVLTGNNE